MIKRFKPTIKLGFVVASISLFASTAQAALLSTAYETQLEIWLGAGDQNFTNIYTYSSGDTPSDFHAAADLKGRTFTIAKVQAEGITQLIGGYNPQSWDASIENFVETPNLADRTAFLFNLTDGVKLTQITDADQGKYQTDNSTVLGPVFGGGHDLELTFSNSYANQYSYGSTFFERNVFGNYGTNIFTISEMEVYTIAPVSAPDASSTLGMLALAMLGLAGVRSRLKRA